MRKLTGWKKWTSIAGAFMLAAFMGGVGHAIVEIKMAQAHDLAHPDYVYGPALGTPVGTESNYISTMFYQTALALTQGDYHGLAQQTSVPPAPSSGLNLTVLKGVGLVVEPPDGGALPVLTSSVGVTTYPDGGFVPAGSQQNSIVAGLGVLSAGAATITFATPFQDGGVPICTATNAQSDGGGVAVVVHAPATNATVVITGSNIDHFTYTCVGPASFGF